MSVTLDGIYVDGQKATFHPEDILTGDASAYTEEIGTAVNAWMEENVTGGEQVTDTTLTLSGVPADAKVTGDEIGGLKEDLSISMGAIPYKGGINTLNNDTTADKTKTYLNVNPESGSNYLKLMKYNATGLTWEYAGSYVPVIDTVSKEEQAEFSSKIDKRFKDATGVIPYHGGINAINSDQSVDTTKVYVVDYEGSVNNGKIMRYNTATLRWCYDGLFKPIIDKASTSYKGVFAEQTHEINNNGAVDISANAYSLSFVVADGMYYHITVKGNQNRFILCGVNGNTAEEIFRYVNNSVPNPATYTFQNTSYERCILVLRYDAVTALEAEYVIAETSTAEVPHFSVSNIPVRTLFADDCTEPYLKAKNIKLGFNSIAESPQNLCLAAAKCIYKQNNIPDYDGYLYFDDVTQKFYYSSNVPDDPKYVFDWDSTLANGEHCKYWAATITSDGDVIFLRDHARSNPIIYPHGDYSTPYVVDFGEATKPYAWLVGSSVVQFNDGSFVFGDYAYHSLSEEQSGGRRIIWRVTKPYNDSSNWEQAHSFKHVHFESLKSNEPDNEIGHIHAIMYDYVSDDLYCTTGDIDRHCRMWISKDHGETWNAVPGAVGTTENTTVQADGQKWRMTNAVFTDDAMYWGTDAKFPYHKLYKCIRDANGNVDFTSLTEVCNLEKFGLAYDVSQRTYIIALLREKAGLLMLDRGEPRGDKLNLTFYDFEKNELYVVAEYDRATTDAGTLEASNRIGLPMQCTTIYEPQSINGIVTGGGKVVRPNNTALFNNSLNNYVGALWLYL